MRDLVLTTHINNGGKNTTAVGHIVTHTHPGGRPSIRSPRTPPVAPRRTSRREARAAMDYPRHRNRHTLEWAPTQQPFRCRNGSVRTYCLDIFWKRASKHKHCTAFAVCMVAFTHVQVCALLFSVGHSGCRDGLRACVITDRGDLQRASVLPLPLLSRALPDASVGCSKPHVFVLFRGTYLAYDSVLLSLSPRVTIYICCARDGLKSNMLPFRPLFSAVAVAGVVVLLVFGWRSR